MPIIKRKLFIDLGHSAKYPGADGYKYGGKSEVDWNRSIWSNLKKLIDTSTWEILLVPDDFGVLDMWNSNRNLQNRINWINKRCSADVDVVLSIHGNAAARGDVRGVTTCYMGGSEVAKREALKLSASYQAITGVPIWGGGAFDDRNGRFGRIGMVRDTKPMALLIEAGFVTSKVDMAVSPGKAAEGINNYLRSLKTP